MIKMTPEELEDLLADSARFPFSFEGNYIRFFDELEGKKLINVVKVEVSYAEEDLECALDDLAWWIKENLDDCPLIFSNSEMQEQLYKIVNEYKEN